ncbi:MAG: hypothetical protein ACRC18_06535 [Cetobacterium sp.]
MRVKWKKFNIEGVILTCEYETMNTYYEVRFDNGLVKYVHVNELEILNK